MDAGIRIALAGDVMLGRGVAKAIGEGRTSLVDDDVLAVARAADLFAVNLECCISERGRCWPSRGKPFFFRAPPPAAELLAGWGVDVVTLANNHVLDYGPEALLDTFKHLDAAGLTWIGAGPHERRAREPCRVEIGGRAVAIVAATDHPPDFAAAPDRAGVAYADLASAVPGWLTGAIRRCQAADLVLCLLHWGPNMVPAPVPHVRRAASALTAAGAGLVAGHSAHVPHGAAGRVLYDLGDFLDDYAVDTQLRNDLGFLFVVTFDEQRIDGEAVPLARDYCHTRLARRDESQPLLERFSRQCAELGGQAEIRDDRLHFPLAY